MMTTTRRRPSLTGLRLTLTIHVLDVWLDVVVVDEDADDVVAALLAGADERRATLAVRHVDVGAALQEDLHDLVTCPLLLQHTRVGTTMMVLF